ncbi:MAG: fibronectin type III domain-containing protein [Candidatus Moranbacteria bacterium]|nr:fibronectin type III domain-containing protein [Candidatus Moranbacteria bacterium]
MRKQNFFYLILFFFFVGASFFSGFHFSFAQSCSSVYDCSTAVPSCSDQGYTSCTDTLTPTLENGCNAGPTCFGGGPVEVCPLPPCGPPDPVTRPDSCGNGWCHPGGISGGYSGDQETCYTCPGDCGGCGGGGVCGDSICEAGEDCSSCPGDCGACETIPPIPANITGSCPAPGTSATVSWASSSGATSYNLRIDNQSNTWSGTCAWTYPGDVCESTFSTSKNISGTPGASYSAWVHACNGFGCSAPISTSFSCANPTPTVTFT